MLRQQSSSYIEKPFARLDHCYVENYDCKYCFYQEKVSKILLEERASVHALSDN